jgi:hypothetical protein
MKSMKRWTPTLWKLVLVMVALGSQVVAQQEQGSIWGLVTDQSGAVVPNVQMTLLNVGTSQSRTLSTGTDGVYVFTPLPIGSYQVTAEVSGFRTEVRTGLELHVQEKLEVDFRLEIGQTNQRVEVKSAAPPLQTAEASLGQVVGQRDIVNLPLNGRNIYQLVVLSPGASISPDGLPTISGQPSQQQSYLLDGVDNNNYQSLFQSGSPWNLQPSPDAIQEFKVQTNNYSAEFGRAGGGIVNVVTKSGTNQFHGDAFEFLRNAAFDGRNFFAQGKPRFDQNQFGSSVGGPMVIPGIYDGHNKTFFFGDYEGFRARTGTTQVQNIPMAAWRSGNFQSYLTGQNFTDPCTGAVYDTGQLFDPTTTTQVTCLDGSTGYARAPISYQGQLNVIDPSKIAPAATTVAGLFPSANLGSSQFDWSPSLAQDFNQFDVKVDHYWGTHDTISMRYAFRDNPPYGIPNLPGKLGMGAANESRQQGATISDSHIISPTTINEIRYGYTRNAFAGHLFNSSINPADEGFGGLMFQPGILGGIPTLNFSDVSSVGAPSWEPSLATARDQVFTDTFSLIRGKHSFKIGGMYNSLWFTSYQSPTAEGAYYFSGVFTSDLNAPNGYAAGSGFAQFMFGLPNLSSYSTSQDSDNGWKSAAVFIQDDWKVTPKLTINLGLRWEFGNTEHERFDRVTGVDFSNGAFEIPVTRKNLQPQLGPQYQVEYVNDPSLLRASNRNIGPRLGIAYHPFSKTVVRAGAGLFYGYPYNSGTLAMPLNPPFAPFVNIQPPNTGAFDPVTGQPTVPVTSMTTGFPGDIFQNYAQDSLLYLYDLAPGKYRWPSIGNYNFGIQQDIARQTTLQIAYAGTKGYHLTTGADDNQPYPSANPNSNPQARRPFPNLGTFGMVHESGTSNYNALQVTLERHYSQGLTFLAGYTWARSLDASPLCVVMGNTGGDVDCYRDSHNRAQDYGNSSFDIRQRFTLSWMYDLPAGHGHGLGANWNGAVNSVLGGWIIGGVEQMQTGFHFTPYSSVDPANSPAYQGVARPDLVGNPTDFSYGSDVQAALGCPVGRRSILCSFNPAAFALPAPGDFGNADRNVVEGPGLVSVDFTLHKDFRFRESKVLEFRAEVFNFINTPNFNEPDQGLQSPTFTRLLSAGAPREIQFALKLLF